MAAFPDNLVSLIPVHKTTPVDIVTGDSANTVGADATLVTDGPPIYSTGYYC